MTKKDFVPIAQAIKEAHQAQKVAHTHHSGCICNRLSAVFQKKNPRFDRGRFLAACIPEEDLCEGYQPSRVNRGYCSSCAQPKKAHSG